MGLCRGAKSIHPNKCFKRANHIFNNQTQASIACRQSSNESAVIHCLHNAPFNFPAEEKATLCQKATTSEPGKCAQLVWQSNLDNSETSFSFPPFNRLFETNHVIDLCNQTLNAEPAICFVKAPKAFSTMQKIQLCKTMRLVNEEAKENSHRNLEKNLKSPEDNYTEVNHHTSWTMNKEEFSSKFDCIEKGLEEDLDPELVLRLCSLEDHEDTAKMISCATKAPFGFTTSAKNFLCENALDSSPSECALEALHLGLSPIECAFLCRYIIQSESALLSSLAPISCLQLVQNSMGKDDALSLCSGTSTLTPAYCGLALPRSYSLVDITRCKASVSRATKLLLHSKQNKQILAGEKFRVSLSLRDQFDQPRHWDNQTYISVSYSIHQNGQNYAHNIASQTCLGEVVFNDLQIDLVGTHALDFCIFDEKRDQISYYDGSNCADVKVRISPKNHTCPNEK